MKKIITLTMIKNEADIVETFVRYTMNFAFKMVFVDNGCVDGSAEILQKLIEEGFNIEVYMEAQRFYDQYIIENKYIKKITNENTFDFLIPLDVDEFLASDEGLFKQIELLSDDRVTMMNWRTYCMLSEKEEPFFLDAIKHYRIDKENVFTKIILPFDILKKNAIFITMGHHDIECKTKIVKKYQEKIYVAHFPVRGIEQIRLKIYQGIVAQLMSSYHSVVAFHWKKIYEELKQKKFDVIKYSKEYALTQDGSEKELKFIEENFDYSWCKASVLPKYKELQNRDILDIIYEMLQVLAIKSIIDKKAYGKRTLIYGTGRTAETMFDYIRDEDYNILAYIDSDTKKEYNLFKDKLIIAPDKIKYIEYDLIIIASNLFNDIYTLLLDKGIPKEKIFSRFDVIEKQL